MKPFFFVASVESHGKSIIAHFLVTDAKDVVEAHRMVLDLLKSNETIHFVEPIKLWQTSNESVHQAVGICELSN